MLPRRMCFAVYKVNTEEEGGFEDALHKCLK